MLVVLVDLRHGLHAGIFGGSVVFARAFLPPVKDATHEWRDEFDAALGAGNGLGQREEQREIAIDAVLLQNFRSLDAFPGGGDLDQNALAPNAVFFIQINDMARLRDRGRRVKGEAGIDFRAHATGNDLEDFRTEIYEDAIHDGIHQRRAAQWGAFVIRDGLVHQRLVFRLLRCGENERWIRGGVLRLVSAHGFEIAGVGDHDGVLFELIELVHKRIVSIRGSGLDARF